MFLPTQPSEKQTMLTTEITAGVHQRCHIHPNEWDSTPCSFRLPLPGSWVDTGSGSSSKFYLGLGERPQPVPARGWSWPGTQARKQGCGVMLGCWLMTSCCHYINPGTRASQELRVQQLAQVSCPCPRHPCTLGKRVPSPIC